MPRQLIHSFTPFILVALLIASFSLAGCAATQEGSQTLFITGTYGALHRGAYDSTVTVADLKRHGDFALGNYSALDGELLGWEGRFYQIGAQGKLSQVDDSWTAPNCTATFFKPDKSISIDKALGYQELQGYLNSQLPTPNYFYALKVTGKFDWIKCRTLTRINKPYPSTPYTTITQNEPTFEFRNIDSTLLMVFTPGHLGEISYPGYHTHCINSGGKYGGHVLDCRLTSGKAEIAILPDFTVNLPRNSEYYKADFSKSYSTGQAGQQESLKAAAAQMQQIIQARLDQMDSDVSKTATSLSSVPFKSAEAKRILNELYNKHPDVINLALTDASGTLVTFAPDKYSSYEGTYIGEREDTKRFNQARQPVLSDMFYTIEGVDALVIKWPVFSDKSVYLGALGMLFKPDELFLSELGRLASQRGMELNIQQIDGLVLYSSGDAEVGKNLFTDPMYQKAVELQALGRNIVAQESGTGFYTLASHQTGQPVKKQAAWMSAGLHGTSWRLVAIKETGQ